MAACGAPDVGPPAPLDDAAMPADTGTPSVPAPPGTPAEPTASAARTQRAGGRGRAIATDAAGNVFVGLSAARERVAKLAPDGRLLWEHAFDGGEFVLLDLATTSTGELLVGLGRTEAPEFGDRDPAAPGRVVKLSSEGAALWAVDLPETVLGGPIALDATGGALVVDTNRLFVPTSNPLLRIDASGSLAWVRRLGPEKPDDNVQVHGVAALPGGDFVGIGVLAEGGEAQSALFGISPEGDLRWVQRLGAFFDLTDVAVSPQGGVVVAGVVYDETATWGPSTLTRGAFVGWLEPDGALGPAASTGAESDALYRLSLALAPDGTALLAQGRWRMEGPTSRSGDACLQSELIAVRGGELLWRRRVGGNSCEADPLGSIRIDGVAAGPGATSHLVGDFWGEVQLGGERWTSSSNDAFWQTGLRPE